MIYFAVCNQDRNMISGKEPIELDQIDNMVVSETDVPFIDFKAVQDFLNPRKIIGKLKFGGKYDGYLLVEGIGKVNILKNHSENAKYNRVVGISNRLMSDLLKFEAEIENYVNKYKYSFALDSNSFSRNTHTSNIIRSAFVTRKNERLQNIITRISNGITALERLVELAEENDMRDGNVFVYVHDNKINKFNAGIDDTIKPHNITREEYIQPNQTNAFATYANTLYYKPGKFSEFELMRYLFNIVFEVFPQYTRTEDNQYKPKLQLYIPNKEIKHVVSYEDKDVYTNIQPVFVVPHDDKKYVSVTSIVESSIGVHSPRGEENRYRGYDRISHMFHHNYITHGTGKSFGYSHIRTDKFVENVYKYINHVLCYLFKRYNPYAIEMYVLISKDDYDKIAELREQHNTKSTVINSEQLRNIMNTDYTQTSIADWLSSVPPGFISHINDLHIDNTTLADISHQTQTTKTTPADISHPRQTANTPADN